MNFLSGIFYLETPKPVDPRRLQAMAGGKDGGEEWSAPGMGLGASSGAAIVHDKEQEAAIAFDGELLNYNELSKELRFSSHGVGAADQAALILRGWRIWGASLFDRLEGKFAFAICDTARQRLVMARDRLGSRTLHSAILSDGSYIFSSTISGLIANPLFRKQIDPAAVVDYLALGFVPDDACLMRGVRKLPAGHYVEILRGQAPSPPVRWWQMRFRPEQSLGASRRALEEQWAGHMRQAVGTHMSGAQAGAMLTELPDDAAIVAFMAEASPRAVPSCTFDAGWDGDTGGNDAGDAVAARFATSHIRHGLSSEALLSALDEYSDLFDEPVAAIQPFVAHGQYRCARRQMARLLSSAGADEILGGHAVYHHPMLLGLIRNMSDKYLKKSRLSSISERAFETHGERFISARMLIPEGLRSALLTDRARRGIGDHAPEARYVRALAEADAEDDAARAQYADIHLSLTATRIHRAEVSAGAAGLDLRTPFLDRRLVEFACGLALRHRMRGAQGKRLMRGALARHLPKEIAWHEGRVASPPLGHWFNTSLAGELAGMSKRSALIETGLFSAAALEALIAEHREARADHGALFWQLLMLDRALGRLFLNRGRSLP